MVGSGLTMWHAMFSARCKAAICRRNVVFPMPSGPLTSRMGRSWKRKAETESSSLSRPEKGISTSPSSYRMLSTVLNFKPTSPAGAGVSSTIFCMERPQFGQKRWSAVTLARHLGHGKVGTGVRLSTFSSMNLKSMADGGRCSGSLLSAERINFSMPEGISGLYFDMGSGEVSRWLLRMLKSPSPAKGVCPVSIS
jgi:hypothetical protein